MRSLLVMTFMKVGDAIRKLEQDGWYLKRTKGSHRQLKHLIKPGTVTVSGKLSEDVPVGTLKSIWKQAQIEED
jgi:predicted RNA binding protein YcfA (HicA-like mRNA interferase family)